MRGVSEVGLGIAAPRLVERVAFDRMELAAIVEEFERAESFAQGGVKAAGADGGQLGRVADQDSLPFRSVDEFEHGYEYARLRHSRLVEDCESARTRSAVVLPAPATPTSP